MVRDKNFSGEALKARGFRQLDTAERTNMKLAVTTEVIPKLLSSAATC